MNYDSMKNIILCVLFYEYVIYEFLLVYEFFPSLKSRSVTETRQKHQLAKKIPNN